MPNINPEELKAVDEIFEELETRLEDLTNKKISIGVWENIKESFSISKIEKNIYNVNINYGINRIEYALKQIKALQAKGAGIMDSIEIEGIGEFNQWVYKDYPSDTKFPKIEEQKINVFQNLQKELEFYRKGLEDLLDELKTNQNSENERTNLSSYTIEISEGYNFSKLRISGDVILDKYQTALLFNYLREKEIILKGYSNAGLAKIAAALTGHSENNLRTEDGFGVIARIKSDKLKNSDKAKGEYYNLNTLNAALKQIIDQINEDINIEIKRVSKK